MVKTEIQNVYGITIGQTDRQVNRFGDKKSGPTGGEVEPLGPGGGPRGWVKGVVLLPHRLPKRRPYKSHPRLGKEEDFLPGVGRRSHFALPLRNLPIANPPPSFEIFFLFLKISFSLSATPVVRTMLLLVMGFRASGGFLIAPPSPGMTMGICLSQIGLRLVSQSK